MRLPLILLPTSLVLVAQPPTATSLRIDVRGLERAIDLMDLLAQDREPSEAQWNALFETPGYEVMVRRERPKEVFMACFRLACSPARAKEREALVASPKDGQARLLARLMPHFLRAAKAREDLRALATELRKESLGTALASQALAYLPPDAPQGPVTVAFILFEPDARGYGPIVMDALFYQDLGEDRTRVLAHELQHAWRAQWAEARMGSDDTAAWVLHQIMIEGVADRVNVAPALATPEARTRFEKAFQGAAYMADLARTGEVFRTLDDLLLRMAQNPSQREGLGEEMRKQVPRSGHPTGFFMASLIEAQLGKSVLIQSQLNPATFFQRYDEAAAREGKAPRLSPPAMAYLRHLCRGWEPYKG